VAATLLAIAEELGPPSGPTCNRSDGAGGVAGGPTTPGSSPTFSTRPCGMGDNLLRRWLGGTPSVPPDVESAWRNSTDLRLLVLLWCRWFIAARSAPGLDGHNIPSGPGIIAGTRSDEAARRHPCCAASRCRSTSDFPRRGIELRAALEVHQPDGRGGLAEAVRRGTLDPVAMQASSPRRTARTDPRTRRTPDLTQPDGHTCVHAVPDLHGDRSVAPSRTRRSDLGPRLLSDVWQPAVAGRVSRSGTDTIPLRAAHRAGRCRGLEVRPAAEITIAWGFRTARARRRNIGLPFVMPVAATSR
jgi:hypothetical protein